MLDFKWECLSYPQAHSFPNKMLERLQLFFLNRRNLNLTPWRIGMGVKGWMETWKQASGG